MPQLSDLIGKKKFVKKSYRPWDLSGEGTIDGKTAVRLDDVRSNQKSSGQENSAEFEAASSVAPALTEVQTAVSVAEIDNETGNRTGNKEVTERVTNREQPSNNQVTIREQRGNKEVTKREQRGNVTGNITGNNQDTFFLSESIKKLGGIQKNIFFYILNLCTARGVLDTGNLLSSDLANAGSCTVGSAKTSLNRLVEKRLVHRLPGKACRGGHMVLGITKEIQAAAMQAQQALFNPLKREVTGNITGNVTGNSFLYTSSSNKNTTTIVLPDEWKKIELEPLQHIGFSETQLRQLCESGITTPEIVQDAIHRFAFSLVNSDKVKAYADPLNVLMGVLRKGQRWNEPHYVPLKERLLRELLDEKRKQKELRDTMIKELIELEFPEWKRKLSEEQFNSIVPEDIRKNNITAAIQAVLRTYFTEQILLPRLENELGA